MTSFFQYFDLIGQISDRTLNSKQQEIDSKLAGKLSPTDETAYLLQVKHRNGYDNIINDISAEEIAAHNEAMKNLKVKAEANFDVKLADVGQLVTIRKLLERLGSSTAEPSDESITEGVESYETCKN